MLRNSGLIILALVGVVSVASSQEKKIQRADLPAAVERTVAAQSVGATIRGFSREQEKGQTYYEAEMIVAGHSKDVLIDQGGTIVEVEEEVALAGLPAEVREGLTAKAGKGQIARVESLTKGGKLVAYEAQVKTAGKRSEIQVGPDGKALSHEE